MFGLQRLHEQVRSCFHIRSRLHGARFRRHTARAAIRGIIVPLFRSRLERLARVGSVPDDTALFGVVNAKFIQEPIDTAIWSRTCASLCGVCEVNESGPS